MNQLIFYIGFGLLICGIITLIILWVQIHREVSQFKISTSNWTTPQALQFLSKLLDDIVSGGDHVANLREYTIQLPQIVRAASERAASGKDKAVRTEVNITYDIIASTQIPLLQNLNDPNELGIDQISGQCGVQWILCAQPPDIASVRNGGWYERLRLFLQGGGVVFYFGHEPNYVDFIKARIKDDPMVKRPIETDESRPTCQIWHVPCDEPALLRPEAVIWNPLGHEKGRARGYINTGESLLYDQTVEGAYVLRSRNRFPIADMDSLLLEAHYFSALKFFNEFIQKLGFTSEFVRILSITMVNENVTESELKTILSLDTDDTNTFIKRHASSRGAALTLLQGGQAENE